MRYTMHDTLYVIHYALYINIAYCSYVCIDAKFIDSIIQNKIDI